MFEVREKGTNRLIGTYKSRNRANNKRDKLDQEYGCYHYYVVNLELSAKLSESTGRDIKIGF